MRNKLECQVTSCQHYDGGLCRLPAIDVDGPAARESNQTCCASYQERGKSGGTAAVHGTASSESTINCQAQHCAYNENCKCQAQCVCVGCCCGDVTTQSGTECCTFCCK